ncbi:MAG: hypothetical protein JWO91_3478, partial [Acidobacteriaceae bacterium]|nr:hypothetical protein [Acidobacteriaceae bacterium]
MYKCVDAWRLELSHERDQRGLLLRVELELED